MANVDAPHGFSPLLTNLDGGPSRIMNFDKDALGGTAIFRNDIVQRETDSNIKPGGTPGTDRYLGASLNYGAASTLSTHAVVISPNALFEAQDNNDTDGIAAADLDLNGNAEFNAGSTTTELSGHEIDESSAAQTASLDLKLIALFDVPGNVHGANARIIVTINKHRFGSEVAGVA